MSILKLLYVVAAWHRCSCCGHMTRPAIRAYDRSAHSTGMFCFRCYHILAAVQLAQPQNGGQ